MRRAGTLCLLMLLVVCGMARVMPAVAMAVPDIPHGLKIRMDSLQKADNLELWVYTWIDALLEDPAGRYQWPGEARRQAWRAPATSDEQSAWFYLLANEGYYQLQHGNIIRSLQAYEEAWRSYSQYPVVGQDEVMEFVLKPLGNNYTRLGDYERAMYILEQGYGLAKESEDHRQQAAFLVNMAGQARTAGQEDRALGYARQALRAEERSVGKGCVSTCRSRVGAYS